MSPTLCERYWQRLNDDNHEVTSDRDFNYNCMAWAVGDVDAKWWPEDATEYYWPEECPREETLDAFVFAFGTLGYETCDSFDPEAGYDKVAIYTDAYGPTHVARQIDAGNWTSKLGLWQDITHSTLRDLEGTLYGAPARFMRRPHPE